MSDILTEERVKKKRSRRLPPGCSKDEFGFYRMLPLGPHDKEGNHTREKRREVIIHPDGDVGRALASQRDADFWDPISELYIYRGVKVMAKGPIPPRPAGLYVDQYPGWVGGPSAPMIREVGGRIGRVKTSVNLKNPESIKMASEEELDKVLVSPVEEDE